MTLTRHSNAYQALVLGLALLGSSLSSPAAPASVKESLRDQELQQVKIKTSTSRVGEQLAEILEELERNRIDGTEVKSLRDIRSMIGSLTERDMTRIVSVLQSARGDLTPSDARQQIANAFSGQKSVIIQLHQIMLEYQNQQKIYELARQLKNLAEDQTVNMRQGVWLANLTENKTFQAYSEFQKNSLRIQHIEQNTIRDRVDQVLQELAHLEESIEDGPNADRPKAAMDLVREGVLVQALETAAQDLDGEKLRLLSAIGQEKKARDQLRDLARVLLMTQDQTEMLRQAVRELDSAIERQKEVIQETKDIKEKDDASNAELSQAEVVDAVDLIQRDIDSIAPLAADVLSEASDDMQEARAALRENQKPENRKEDALPRENSALDQLQMARRELMDQLAQAMETPEVAKSNLEALREMQQQVQELKQSQEQLKSDTASAEEKDLPAKAPEQGAMRDKATNMEQQASKLSPLAAEHLGEAADQMKQSQQSLAKAQNNPQAQQEALDALNRASEQLAQEIAELEKAQEELAQLRDLVQELKQVIEDQQNLQLSTASLPPTPPLEAFTALSTNQSQLSQRTGELETRSAAQYPEATSHLGEATRQMRRAVNELDQEQSAPAREYQSEALVNLQLARRILEDRMQELQAMLGLPQEGMAGPDALALIEKAQREVGSALELLQQAPPGLMDSLLEQQRQISEGMNQLAEDYPLTLPVDGRSAENISPAAQAQSQATLEIRRHNYREALRILEDHVGQDPNTSVYDAYMQRLRQITAIEDSVAP